MAEDNTNYEGVIGEDYIVLTPEKNMITITPWSLRLINTTERSFHIAFSHTNLMTKVLVISNTDEKDNESEEIKEKIAGRIGKEI